MKSNSRVGLTKERVNLSRSMDNFRFKSESATRFPPLTVKTSMTQGPSSTKSGAFSSKIAGRFYKDGSFAAHERDKEKERKEEAMKKMRSRAREAQSQRQRVEKELVREKARIEALERRLQGRSSSNRGPGGGSGGENARKKRSRPQQPLSPIDNNTGRLSLTPVFEGQRRPQGQAREQQTRDDEDEQRHRRQQQRRQQQEEEERRRQ
eukprot:CAMPEP_0119478562 /NCGR_PEP_ID=MMETSP1344-20130328/8242_1 /TAXON_ID=236787 /ORGANISM="Florenciella parvula, Strain CCMP2471" /LENGTH=207 /DNA_ID=CAMNT_0007512741 /DNA_START=53 /DNA_END=673 /DNA_ORIENTATION=+